MFKIFSLGFVIVSLCAAPALAQQRGQGRGNPGVSPTTIMDTPDVRVARVQLDAGATRPSHVHNEGPFHMVVAVSGPLQVFFGPEGKEKQIVKPAWLLKRRGSRSGCKRGITGKDNSRRGTTWH